jgi:hypothetical protein
LTSVPYAAGRGRIVPASHHAESLLPTGRRSTLSPTNPKLDIDGGGNR